MEMLRCAPSAVGFSYCVHINNRGRLATAGAALQLKWKCYAAAGVPLCLSEGATFAVQVSLKGQHLHFNRHTAGSGCGRMHASTGPETNGTVKNSPAAPLPRISAVLPHASLQSRSNAAPAQRAQPPCLLSLQRASRRCHAAPRRFRYCSERLFRHAQALPPRSGCNLHV